MRSIDDDDIYVVGECAQHRGQVYGLVAPLWEQAEVLADHMTGADPRAAYHGSRIADQAEGRGRRRRVDGRQGARAARRRVRAVLRTAARRLQDHRHPRRQTRRRHPASATSARSSFLTQAFDSGLPLPDERVSLMFDIGTPDVAVGVAELADDAQVCNCNGVSKGSVGGVRRSRRDVGERRDGDDEGGQGLRILQGTGGADRRVGRGRRGRGRSVGQLVCPGDPVRQAEVDAADPRTRTAFGVVGFRCARPGGEDRRRDRRWLWHRCWR